MSCSFCLSKFLCGLTACGMNSLTQMRHVEIIGQSRRVEFAAFLFFNFSVCGPGDGGGGVCGVCVCVCVCVCVWCVVCVCVWCVRNTTVIMIIYYFSGCMYTFVLIFVKRGVPTLAAL